MLDFLDGVFGFHTHTFNIGKTATILQVSTDQVRQWIVDGTLPAKKMFGMTRISYRTIERACKGELLVVMMGLEGTTLDYLRIGERIETS